MTRWRGEACGQSIAEGTVSRPSASHKARTLSWAFDRVPRAVCRDRRRRASFRSAGMGRELGNGDGDGQLGGFGAGACLRLSVAGGSMEEPGQPECEEAAASCSWRARRVRAIRDDDGRAWRAPCSASGVSRAAKRDSEDGRERLYTKDVMGVRERRRLGSMSWTRVQHPTAKARCRDRGVASSSFSCGMTMGAKARRPMQTAQCECAM